MESDARRGQLDLLVYSEATLIQNQRLTALDRAELVRLLKLLLTECVAATARASEVANEQDHA